MQSATLDYVAVPFNEWFNFKVILNNNSVEWFVSNSLVEVDEVLFTSIGHYQENGVPNLDLGRSNRVYDTFFYGLIDEIILLKDESNLLGHWNFNSGQGDVLADISENGNDGNINGAVWSGDVFDNLDGPVTFTKEDYADPSLAENQDRITENVWITRGNDKPLYNAAIESSYNDQNYDHSTSPAGTEWSSGLT